jgi:putative transposase
MKPGVFSQVYVQLVFSPKSKETLFRSRCQREEVWKYISGVVTNKNHKSIIINGTKDHVHIFLGLNPAMAISSLVADIKRSSSIFINEKKWFPGKFNWQEGYGVFSYSRS